MSSGHIERWLGSACGGSEARPWSSPSPAEPSARVEVGFEQRSQMVQPVCSWRMTAFSAVVASCSQYCRVDGGVGVPE